MHASAIIFFVVMAILIIVLAAAIYLTYGRLEVCVNVQSPTCPTITCPCDGSTTACGGSAYRVNDAGQTVCSDTPAVPLKTES